MAKADPAHRAADAALDGWSKEVQGIYAEAEKAARENLTAYLAQFKAEDEDMRQQLADGKITAKTYRRWRSTEIMRGKQYRQTLSDMAASYANADALSVAMAAGKLPEVYAENYNYGAYQAETGAGVSTSFNLQDANTVQVMMTDRDAYVPLPSLDYPASLAWNRRLLGNQITKGVLLGESIENIADRVQKVTGSNLADATRTARTCTTAAENAGRVASYRRAEDMGIKLEQEWLATLDGRTRHSHRLLDGERVKVGEAFSNGCRYPGDPDAPAGEIMNCRCTLVAAVEGVDTSDAERRSKLPKGQSYEDWKAGKDPAPRPKPRAAAPKAAKAASGPGMPSGIEKLTGAQRGRLDGLLASKDFDEAAKVVYSKGIGNCTLRGTALPRNRVAHFSCSSSDFGVTLDAAKVFGGEAETWFHEFGHHLDWNATGTDLYLSSSFRDGAFGKSLKHEANAYVNARNKELKAEFESRRAARDADWLLKNGYISRRDADDVRKGTDHGERVLANLRHSKQNAYKSVSNEITAMGTEAKQSVSDIFGGATANRAVDGWGHPASYWRPSTEEARYMSASEKARWASDQLGAEGFAEFFSAYCCNPESKRQLKRYFPESAKLFEEMLGEMEGLL